jgi:catechol 2,3-dioxygenase-like lactoylglutathione lyase family enzyme
MKQMYHVLIAVCLSTNIFAQTDSAIKTTKKMKLNAGIITTKLAETKAFYTGILNFGVSFENDFYLLMHTPGHTSEISFLLPDHPSQQALFHKPFQGQGMYLTIEVEDVDKIFEEIKNKGIEIKIGLRDEPWGDRHFAIEDPNGIGIDVVTYNPENK